ncbi:metalloendopeptidase, partial [Coemansia sp. RSA 2598]
KFDIDTFTREDLFKVMSAVHENKAEMEKLCDEDKRLVIKVIDGFLNNGLALPKEEKEKLKKMRKDLSDMEINFAQNISADKSKILFTREELAGLPESFFEDRELEVVDGVKKYVVTTKYPDLLPVMGYAKCEETRQRLSILNNTRCPENVEILQKAVCMRREAAKLLGYKNHAELALKNKMAKTPENVMQFENDLLAKLTVIAKQEIKEFERLKKQDKEAAGKKYEGLFSWDFSYYNNKLKEEKYSIDNEEIKQYFSLEKVVPGILKIYEDMLSLHFVKVDNPPVWHPDVEMYEAWEADKQTFVGHFYLDMYPRDDKYSHAAMFPLRNGAIKPDGSFEYPSAALVTNFPKPTSTTPALLTHDDFETLMHELGHVFHHICSHTRWAEFFGTSVQRDFVEAPSQMLENWAWEPSVLQRMAVHYKTGEVMPESLMNNLIAARYVNSGISNLNQVFYGLYDMKIHMSEKDDINVSELYNKLRSEISFFKSGMTKTWGVATFGHIMGGYVAGYYGYLWSKVFSADMFEARFKKEGLFNEQTGIDYRKEVLLPGGSRDAEISLEKFLGRKPQNTAFLKAIGLDSVESA